MKIAAFKLKMFVTSGAGARIINNNLEKLGLRFILWSFGAFLLMYVLIFAGMIGNIIERQNLEGRARLLSNEVRDLEAEYLSLSNKVDLAFSHSMGFRETKATFATRKSLGLGSFSKSAGEGVQNDL